MENIKKGIKNFSELVGKKKSHPILKNNLKKHLVNYKKNIEEIDAGFRPPESHTHTFYLDNDWTVIIDTELESHHEDYDVSVEIRHKDLVKTLRDSDHQSYSEFLHPFTECKSYEEYKPIFDLLERVFEINLFETYWC